MHFAENRKIFNRLLLRAPRFFKSRLYGLFSYERPDYEQQVELT